MDNFKQQSNSSWASWMRPELPLLISEWADRYRILSSAVSAEPGAWQTSRVPYAKEWMDSILDPKVVDVSLMTAAQVAKSSVVENVIGFFSHHDPCPILLVEPTIEKAEEVSRTRLQAMIDDTPVLKERYTPEKSRSSGNTLRLKEFHGGVLYLVGANSTSGLSSRSVRLLLCDEVDRFPAVAGEEGDTLELATARTTTFWNKKHIYTSTPTVDGASRIQSLFNAGDQRYYYVPCPECHELMLFKNDKDTFIFEHSGDTVVEGSCHMVCQQCGSTISERQKNKMVAQGKWIPKFPERVKHRSYQLNAFYSPWVSWTQMAEEFLKATHTGPELLQPYTNLRLAEPWKRFKDVASTLPEELFLRRAEYKVPTDVLMITCGIDVQQNRLEALVIGWGVNYQSWVLEHRVFLGTPDSRQTWLDVDEFLNRVYTRDDSRQMAIDITLIDSGYMTPSVRAFTTPRYGKVHASIGRNSKDIFTRESDEQGNPYLVIAVDQLKTLVLTRLHAEKDKKGFMNFNLNCDLEFFRQLTAERLTTVYERGVSKEKWIQDRPRNEILDCYVLNFGCTFVKVPGFDGLLKNRGPVDANSVQKAPETKADSAAQGAPLPVHKPQPKQQSVRNPFARPPHKNWVTGWK